MSAWRQVARGVRALLRSRSEDEDVAEEVRHYFDEALAELIASGRTPAEARRLVRQRFGDPLAVREAVRRHGWESTIDALLADLRYAARRLRRSPGFTGVAVCTLGLGIAAATAIFSAVRPVLFAPLPYPRGERIMFVSDRAQDGSHLDVTFGTYREVLGRNRAFSSLAVMRPWRTTLTGDSEPERLEGQRVSADYFRVLGVAPLLGRDFDEADDRPGGRNVLLLSEGIWRRRFGGDSTLVGRQLRLDDDIYTVLGVLPREFENATAPSAEVWSLLQYDAAAASFDVREWGHHLRMIGRLRDGIDVDAARAELDNIARDAVPDFVRPRWAALELGLSVLPLRDAVIADARPALSALLGAVLLLLGIACVNVTNLLLARGAQRRGELALRAALGAARTRLAAQLIAESLLLGLVGGGLGLLLAGPATRALAILGPASLLRFPAVGLDGYAFGFALATTLVVGIAVGLVPAVNATRRDLQPGLGQASRRTTGAQNLALRRALVVAEVAVAVVLLVGAGLLLRSVQRLFAGSPGFDASHTLVMQVHATGGSISDDRAREGFFRQALAAVRQLPGVTGAAFTSQLPLSGDADVYGVQFATQQLPGDHGAAYRYAVSDGYFELMRIPILHGRALDAGDVAGAPGAAVISESFARRKFPQGDAIGQRLHVGRTDLPWYTVVGVAGDVKQASLAVGVEDAVYLSSPQWYFADEVRWLVIRARAGAADLLPAVKRAIWSVDGDQPILRVGRLDTLVTSSEAQRRFAMFVLEVFAVMALVLAGLGLYGVLAGSVAERAHEMGVRSALGASRRSILLLVLRQGMALTTLGVLIGLLAALAASRAVAALLFGVSRLDPFTYLGVVTLIVGVSTAACALPAWRAAHVDPARTLNAD